jgi:uncharacterized damage-inducible protein DinB
MTTTHPASIPAPADGEYAPFYAGYVAAVAGVDLRPFLTRQLDRLDAACGALSDADALARYAPGKWSIKEVLGHLADVERIFTYRTLRIARGDTTPLPGFDENAYVVAAGADGRSLDSLREELRQVRAATLSLLDSVAPDAWERRGTASGAEVSVRALAHMAAGHVEHHLGILRERYGLAVPAA